MDETNIVPDYPRGLTFEKVWAAMHASNERMERMSREADRRMQETDRQMQETKARQEEVSRQIEETGRQMRETKARQEEVSRQIEETGRQMRETRAMQEETARQMRETDRKMRETDRQMQETDRKMQESNRRFDDFSNRFGEIVEYMVIPNLVDKFEELGFTFTKANRTEVKDKKNQLFFEVDALLENGEKVMAVEIKSKPKGDDIDYHLERMEKLRQYADLHDDKRIYLGAMAGAVFSDSLKMYSLKHGLYVIEPSGETFRITVPEGAYHPREW